MANLKNGAADFPGICPGVLPVMKAQSVLEITQSGDKRDNANLNKR